MNISQEDAILIKNLYLSKQYGAQMLLSELPSNGWKLGSTDSKRIRKKGTTVIDRMVYIQQFLAHLLPRA